MKRILIVGMAGAGNLGDDLISHLLVNQLKRRWPRATVGVLIGQEGNPFGYRYRVTKLYVPRKSQGIWTQYRQQWNRIDNFLEKSTLLVIGGGGLLQDTHHPFTPHKWLRYLRRVKKTCSVWGLGLGVGPIAHPHNRYYLAKVLPSLNVLQVRDRGSQRLLKRLQVDAKRSVDVVAGSNINDTPFGVEVTRGDGLGCNIRPWPGLPEEEVRRTLLDRSSLGEQVRLFVFEYKDQSAGAAKEELRTANQLQAFLAEKGRRATVFCYHRDEIGEFARAFATVSRAIACRYHAHILWQKLGVPTAPVSYAPKVKRLYRERGVTTVAIDDGEAWRESLCYVEIDLAKQYRLPSRSNLVGSSGRGSGRVPFGIMMVYGLVSQIYGVIHGIRWRVVRWLRWIVMR